MIKESSSSFIPWVWNTNRKILFHTRYADMLSIVEKAKKKRLDNILMRHIMRPHRGTGNLCARFWWWWIILDKKASKNYNRLPQSKQQLNQISDINTLCRICVELRIHFGHRWAVWQAEEPNWRKGLEAKVFLFERNCENIAYKHITPGEANAEDVEKW